MSTPLSPPRPAVVWHDVECGSYTADLSLWEELATAARGPVLELGCGTGRVALHLARRGHRVIGLDRDPSLLASLAERAAGLPLCTVRADACRFQLDAAAGLALAPMQIIQLLAGEAERLSCLRAVAANLRPGGLLALAIVERVPAGGTPPLPDLREVDGWVYASQPLAVVEADGEIAIRRLRQLVSPRGELRDEHNEVRIQTLDAARLEAEGRAAGYRVAARREIPATDLHVGSAVVVLERPR